MMRTYRRGWRDTVDWQLVIFYLLLVLFGWLNIYASVHSAGGASIIDWSLRSGKQFVWMLTSFSLAAVILFAVSPRLWEVISSPAYLVVLLMLVAVIFLGTPVKGSHSWFSFGAVKFQPAEISKITTSLLLAAVMSRPSFSFTRPQQLLRALAIVLLPMLIIVAESETGTALVYVGFLFVLYREGLSGWWILLLLATIFLSILTLKTSVVVALIVLGVLVAAYIVVLLRRERSARRRRAGIRRALACLAGGVILVCSVGFAFENILQDHQRKRIEVLLGMKEDPSGVGYNVRQSMIAIGSGGFIGKGYLQGTQTTYGFVPEQSTDFIFCTIGEEYGFVGCLLFLILYGLMITRIVADAEKCREVFTRIYGYCLASCLFMHLFINIGMTVGIMPVIGIPLPFLSYGGSSLWAFTVMLFIFIALYRQEKKYF